MLGQLDHLASQQLQRPARAAGGRLAAGRRHQQRRLVRYTVEPPAPTLRAISSSEAPASAASRICARFSLRAACLPPLSSVPSSERSAWLSSTRYRTFILISSRGDQTSRTMSQKSGTAR